MPNRREKTPLRVTRGGVFVFEKKTGEAYSSPATLLIT